MNMPASFPRISSLTPTLGALPSPDEWIKKTSLTFSKRSPSTLAMDECYKAFYAQVNKSPDQERYAAHLLYNQMKVYLREKHGMWSKCERNKASKGFMADLFKALEKSVAVAPSVGHAAALAKIDSEEIPHARFGVLYLLSNISVELSAANYASMAFEGLSVAGTAVSLGTTFDISKNDPTKLSGDSGNAIFSATGNKMTSKSVGMGKLPSQNASTFISAGGGALGLGKTIASTDGTNQKDDRVLGAAFRPDTPFKLAEQWQKFKQWVYNKIVGVIETLRTKMLADGDWPASLAGSAIKALIEKAVVAICQASAPYVGSGIEIFTGLAKTFAAVAQKFSMVSLRKKFELREGHPAELARAIEEEMEMDIGAGVKDVLKGVGGLSAQIFLPGAGALVSAVMTAIEWLVKTIMRLAEAHRIGDFLKLARQMYDREPRQNYQTGNFAPAAKDRGGLVHDTARFTEFFKEGCKASAIIPMLTLNTGICGSLMTMIRMVNDLGDTSQRSYDAGTDYFSALKHYAAKYMRDSGFSFKARERKEVILHTSDETTKQKAAIKSVQGLLNHALNSHQVMSDWKTKVGAAVLA
ncbi:hypothetical protein [Caballeronia sp. LZ032]|uniref:hypothetical protein n=1 Tax=Caballeronia sp. LZ032 TaxID=3038565 RepID=UPI00285AFD85|nr:hypothetical protein [Caballeronia sp. LZ032]MDR5880070.1 hypothetical protein [Caballeronia sp. LZ032]